MSDAIPEISFRATLQLHGKTATGIEVPAEVVERLGAGKKPAVRVTIGGHTYRSTIAARGERFLVGVSSENRAAAGAAAGDELDVVLVLDAAPREVDVPADLAAALADAPDAKRFFEGLTYPESTVPRGLGIRRRHLGRSPTGFQPLRGLHPAGALQPGTAYKGALPERRRARLSEESRRTPSEHASRWIRAYSDRRAHVLSIEGAKTAETRQRRVERAVEKLLAGKAR